MTTSFPTCLFCEQRIGVYEPLVVIEHEQERKTSLAREPELRHRAHLLLVHADCLPVSKASSAGQP